MELLKLLPAFRELRGDDGLGKLRLHMAASRIELEFS